MATTSTCSPPAAADPALADGGRLLLLAPGRLHGVLDQGDQRVPGRLTVPGVAHDDRHARVEIQRELDLGRLERPGAFEAVDGDDERQAAPLEVVHRREA